METFFCLKKQHSVLFIFFFVVFFDVFFFFFVFGSIFLKLFQLAVFGLNFSLLFWPI